MNLTSSYSQIAATLQLKYKSYKPYTNITSSAEDFLSSVLESVLEESWLSGIVAVLDTGSCLCIKLGWLPRTAIIERGRFGVSAGASSKSREVSI